jgi:hypothetical protein
VRVCTAPTPPRAAPRHDDSMSETTTTTTTTTTGPAPAALGAALRGDEVELLLCTHLTVVVRARLEFEDGGSDETGLVIPRQRCDGDQPHAAALAEAAHACAVQLQRKADDQARPLRAISACRGGRWAALWQAAAPPLHA